MEKIFWCIWENLLLPLLVAMGVIYAVFISLDFYIVNFR